MSFQKMVPFLFLNIIVSLVTVLAVLALWDRQGNRPISPPSSPPTAPAAGVVPVPQQSAGSAPVVAESAESPAAPESAPALPETATHTVAAGQSLGAIALQYDVPVDDIVRANNLANPNQIFVGQQLIIPIGGLVEPTPTPWVEPTPLPIDEVQIGESNVTISTVQSAGALPGERIEIVNTGANPVDLTGWTLSDEAGLRYTFPDGVLYGDGAGVSVLTGTGNDTPLERHWGLAAPVWESGKTAVLRAADGSTRASFVIP
jgi:LysM repeat protein